MLLKGDMMTFQGKILPKVKMCVWGGRDAKSLQMRLLLKGKRFGGSRYKRYETSTI